MFVSNASSVDIILYLYFVVNMNKWQDRSTYCISPYRFVVTTQQECINVSQTISMTINTDGTASRSIYNCKINDILDRFPWPFWLIMHYIIICNNKSYWEYNLVSRLPKNWGSSHSISPGISRWIVKCLMLIQLYSIREYPFMEIGRGCR
jgi:hypothetical protein